MDTYASMIALLASGARLPAEYIDRQCTAAGRTAGELAGDLLRRLDLTPLCPCGGHQRVYSVRKRGDGGRTQYLRCQCGRHSKRVCYGVAKRHFTTEAP